MSISNEEYKSLRIRCTEGQQEQIEIFEKFAKSIDYQNLLDYTKLLVNVTVANREIQLKVFQMLRQIPINPQTEKYVLMIVNNILADQRDLTSEFLNQNLEIFQLVCSSLINDSDELFEWAFYVFSKICPGNLLFFDRNLNTSDMKKILNFLISLCEKAWKNEENIIPSLFKIEDLITLSRIFEEHQHEVLILINYASRVIEFQRELADCLLELNILPKFYSFLDHTTDDGMKGVVLQLISNSLCLKTFFLVKENLKVVLKSAELDQKQPTCREWVFVIIKKGIEISPEFAQDLHELKVDS